MIVIILLFEAVTYIGQFQTKLLFGACGQNSIQDKLTQSMEIYNGDGRHYFFMQKNRKNRKVYVLKKTG